LQQGADKGIKANDGSSAMDLIHAPELHCSRQVQQLLATSHDKQAETGSPEKSRLSAVIEAYGAHVDKAGRAYQAAKEEAVKARGFSGLHSRQLVQSRQHLFVDFRDKSLNLIVLLKDAKKLAWKAAQDNDAKASREESDDAVVRKFGKRITEDGLQALQAQFYWADAYSNVLTMLDQHWGAWSVDGRKKTLNASNMDLQSKLNKELKAIRELDTYFTQQGK